MSDFEYASVVVSIVLALGIADILRFIGDTVREFDAKKLYWVHLLWILVLLQLHIEFWWRMWDFRSLLEIGPRLAFLLLGPALLFVATRTLLPARTGDDSLTELFYRRKNAFFVLMILLSLWSLAASPWSLASGPEESQAPAMIASALVFLLFGSCIIWNKRWLQQGTVLLVAIMEILEILSWQVGS